MTIKNIEDVVAEFDLILDDIETDNDNGEHNVGYYRSSYKKRLEKALNQLVKEVEAEAHQAGIDEAVEVVRLKKQDFNEHICRFNDAPQKCECYEKALNDTIKALQDNK